MHLRKLHGTTCSGRQPPFQQQTLGLFDAISKPSGADWTQALEQLGLDATS